MVFDAVARVAPAYEPAQEMHKATLESRRDTDEIDRAMCARQIGHAHEARQRCEVLPDLRVGIAALTMPGGDHACASSSGVSGTRTT